jgi:hypothetical protein
VVNNGDGILDTNILIDNFMDINMGYIDLGNVDTVGAIVAMAIVYFPGSKWNP